MILLFFFSRDSNFTTSIVRPYMCAYAIKNPNLILKVEFRDLSSEQRGAGAKLAN